MRCSTPGQSQLDDWPSALRPNFATATAKREIKATVMTFGMDRLSTVENLSNPKVTDRRDGGRLFYIRSGFRCVGITGQRGVMPDWAD